MTTKLDVHQHITQQIVTAIEAGAGQWQMPWYQSANVFTRPLNATSGHHYRGINILALWVAAAARNYEHGLWATYKQWQEAGAQVRKGEASTMIVFYKQLDVTSKDDPDTQEKIHFARASRVFNVAQVDGFTLPEDAAPEREDRITPIDAADAFAAGTGAAIETGGASACYRPSTDTIHMPDRDRFFGSEHSSATETWYSTLLHELTHWSGAKHRLDRDLANRFGDRAYAMEELVAELGAAFLCAELGITNEPRPDHAQYLGFWLDVLKSDSRAVFTAAAKAQSAVDYLKGLQPSS